MERFFYLFLNVKQANGKTGATMTKHIYGEFTPYTSLFASLINGLLVVN